MKRIRVQLNNGEWKEISIADLYWYDREEDGNVSLLDIDWSERPLPTYYFSDKGDKVIIKDMHDGYLLNSYAHKKKRKEEIESKTPVDQMGSVMEHLAGLNDLIEALRQEIKERGLI